MHYETRADKRCGPVVGDVTVVRREPGWKRGSSHLESQLSGDGEHRVAKAFSVEALTIRSPKQTVFRVGKRRDRGSSAVESR